MHISKPNTRSYELVCAVPIHRQYIVCSQMSTECMGDVQGAAVIIVVHLKMVSECVCLARHNNMNMNHIHSNAGHGVCCSFLTDHDDSCARIHTTIGRIDHLSQGFLICKDMALSQRAGIRIL